MNEIYKLEFEVVSAIGRGVQYYRGEMPICKPVEVPDEFWSKVSKQTDNPWDQYNTLKKWAETGEQLIRNVRLLKATSLPKWEAVP